MELYYMSQVENYLSGLLMIKCLIIALFGFIPPKKVNIFMPLFSIAFGISCGLSFYFLIADNSIFYIKESFIIIFFFIALCVFLSLEFPCFNRVQIFSLFFGILYGVVDYIFDFLYTWLFENKMFLYIFIILSITIYLIFVGLLIIKRVRFNLSFLNLQLVLLSAFELAKILTLKIDIDIPKEYFCYEFKNDFANSIINKIFNIYDYEYYFLPQIKYIIVLVISANFA